MQLFNFLTCWLYELYEPHFVYNKVHKVQANVRHGIHILEHFGYWNRLLLTSKDRLPIVTTGRPFVKQFALCCRTVICPVCPVVLLFLLAAYMYLTSCTFNSIEFYFKANRKTAVSYNLKKHHIDDRPNMYIVVQNILLTKVVFTVDAVFLYVTVRKSCKCTGKSGTMLP